MNDTVIFIGLAILAVVALNTVIIVSNAKDGRKPKDRQTVSEMQIEVSADTSAATQAIEKLRGDIEAVTAAAREVDDLLAGRSAPSIERLSFAEGDTLVIMAERLVSSEHRARLTEYAERVIPEGVKVMVLDGGMSVAVLSSVKSE